MRRYTIQKLIRTSLLFCCLLILVAPQITFALSPEQKKVFDQGIGYYDVEEDLGDCSSKTTSLNGKDNLEKALNFYIGKGLTLAQAAGILGNFKAESGVDPKVQELGKPKSSDPDVPTDGTGYGIAQWTFSSRQQPLVNLAKSRNAHTYDLAIQLDYSWQEMSGTSNLGRTLPALKATTTASDAAFQFHKIFEGSNDDPSRIKSNRMDVAEDIARTYGGGQVSNGTGGVVNCSGVAGSFTETIKKYAWPKYETGKTDETAEYSKAIDAAAANGKDYVGSNHGVDCGAFVTRVFRDSGADKTYNDKLGNVAAQHQYLAGNPTKYQELPHGPKRASDLKLGDIYIAPDDSHTFIFLGKDTVFPGYNAATASQGDHAPSATNAAAYELDSGIWYRPLFPLN